MQYKCVYLHSLFVHARIVPETCGAGGDTRMQAPRRRQCSRAVRHKRLHIPSVRQTAFRDPPCGGQRFQAPQPRRPTAFAHHASGSVPRHAATLALFFPLPVTCFSYITSPLLPTNNVSHAGDTCILLREEEPVIRQRSETCRAGETVRSPPLRRGKD